MSLLILWIRRLWPYLVLAAILGGSAMLGRACNGGGDDPALRAAHEVTLVQERLVHVADTVFQHDTVVAKRAVTVYRTARDTVLQHLTDTVQVKQAFAAADNALELDSTAIASAARAIQAHVVLEGALRTELAISNRLRAPRYQLSATTGMELTAPVLVTAMEATMRVTERWAVVGRVDKRWAPGEPTRRYVLARYTF